MSSFVEIAGKKYENVGEAARLTGYSRDYIGRLSREQKIPATQVGRQWFVSIPSLLQYAKQSAEEQKIRKRQLSTLRKQEREAAILPSRVAQAKKAKSQKSSFYSTAVAMTVLSLGVGLGVTLNAVSLFNFNSNGQIASAPTGGDFKEVVEEFPVATGKVVESTELEAIDFSKESMTISTLDAEGKGVLLLPSGSETPLTAQEVKKLFSDPVSVVKDSEGNSYVVRTNQDGTKEPLPFAVVPVANKETP